MEYRIGLHGDILSTITGLFEKYYNLVSICKKALKSNNDTQLYQSREDLLVSLQRPIFAAFKTTETVDLIRFAYDLLIHQALDSCLDSELKFSIATGMVPKLLRILQPDCPELDDLVENQFLIFQFPSINNRKK
jgi:hypothetical protein